MATVYGVTAGSGDTYCIERSSSTATRLTSLPATVLGHDHPGQGRAGGSATEVISAISAPNGNNWAWLLDIAARGAS
jgi:hypothetical protein